MKQKTRIAIAGSVVTAVVATLLLAELPFFDTRLPLWTYVLVVIPQRRGLSTVC